MSLGVSWFWPSIDFQVLRCDAMKIWCCTASSFSDVSPWPAKMLSPSSPPPGPRLCWGPHPGHWTQCPAPGCGQQVRVSSSQVRRLNVNRKNNNSPAPASWDLSPLPHQHASCLSELTLRKYVPSEESTGTASKLIVLRSLQLKAQWEIEAIIVKSNPAIEAKYFWNIATGGINVTCFEAIISSSCSHVLIWSLCLRSQSSRRVLLQKWRFWGEFRLYQGHSSKPSFKSTFRQLLLKCNVSSHH